MFWYFTKHIRNMNIFSIYDYRSFFDSATRPRKLIGIRGEGRWSFSKIAPVSRVHYFLRIQKVVTPWVGFVVPFFVVFLAGVEYFADVWKYWRISDVYQHSAYKSFFSLFVFYLLFVCLSWLWCNLDYFMGVVVWFFFLHI